MSIDAEIQQIFYNGNLGKNNRDFPIDRNPSSLITRSILYCRTK